MTRTCLTGNGHSNKWIGVVPNKMILTKALGKGTVTNTVKVTVKMTMRVTVTVSDIE